MISKKCEQCSGEVSALTVSDLKRRRFCSTRCRDDWRRSLVAVEKLCPVCGVVKSSSEFYTKRNGQPQCYCKPCYKARWPRKAPVSPEDRARYDAKYKLTHSDAVRESKLAYRMKAQTDSGKRQKALSRNRAWREKVADGVARIYFVQCESGFIKIGFAATGMTTRMAMLQTGNHEELRLIAEIPDATREQETRLHWRFDSLRHRGEWFRPAPELLAFIATEAKAVDERLPEKAERRPEPPAQESGAAGDR